MFDGCSNLAYVTIEESEIEEIQSAPLTIGAAAFKGTKLSELKLPSRVTSIENGAFACNQLQTVMIDAPFDFTAEEVVGPFYNSNTQKATLLKSIFCNWHQDRSQEHTDFVNNLQKHVNQF
jgi:hypothetical protein